MSVEFPVTAIHISETEKDPRIDFVVDGKKHTHHFWSTVHKVFPKLKSAVGYGHVAWGGMDAIRKAASQGKFTIRYSLNQKDSFIVRLRYLPTKKLVTVFGSTYEGWGYINDGGIVEKKLKEANRKNGWSI